jgi:hypothetical protein
VESVTPCATSTPERTRMSRQLNFSGRRMIGKKSSQGESTGGAISCSNSKISTPRRGCSSTQFKMEGRDPMIRLPEFQREASKDPEKHVFICEKIWDAKKIKDEDTKIAQLAIMLRNPALDWYMSLDVTNPPGVTRTIPDMKIILLNDF